MAKAICKGSEGGTTDLPNVSNVDANTSWEYIRPSCRVNESSYIYNGAVAYAELRDEQRLELPVAKPR